MHFLAHGDELGVAVAVLPPDHGRKVVGRVVLDYDACCLRRKRLATEGGAAFLVDLPQTVSLDTGAAFALADGNAIEVAEAHEPVLRIEGDLPRLAPAYRQPPLPWREWPRINGDPRRSGAGRHAAEAGGKGGKGLRAVSSGRGAYGHGRTFGHAH